MANTEQFQTVV